jgi:hypothetical protein
VSTPENIACKAGLLTALVALQGEVPHIAKEAQGQTGNQTYKYTPLEDIAVVVQPLLTKHKLAWVTLPSRAADGEWVLKYRLSHAPSGESIEDEMPLALAKHEDPKAHGSSITYARRHAITAVLNIQASKDDDGQAAAKGSNRASGRVGRSPQGVTARPPQRTERLATAQQRGMINAQTAGKGLPPTSLADIANAVAGGEPIDWESQSAAENWLRRAMDRLPAHLVDPILARIAEIPAEVA